MDYLIYFSSFYVYHDHLGFEPVELVEMALKAVKTLITV